MFKDLRFRNLVVDAFTGISQTQDDPLTRRARHRDMLLQNISNDIQTIIYESELSIDDAIDEWIMFDCIDSKNIPYRRKFAKSAIRKFPVREC